MRRHGIGWKADDMPTLWTRASLRKCLGEAAEGELRGAIGRIAVDSDQAGARRDHQNMAAAPLLHVRINGAHGMHRALKVRFHLPLEGRACIRLEGAGSTTPAEVTRTRRARTSSHSARSRPRSPLLWKRRRPRCGPLRLLRPCSATSFCAACSRRSRERATRESLAPRAA